MTKAERAKRLERIVTDLFNNAGWWNPGVWDEDGDGTRHIELETLVVLQPGDAEALAAIGVDL